MDGWVGGWMGGRESQVKDCLQQSKISNKTLNYELDQSKLCHQFSPYTKKHFQGHKNNKFCQKNCNQRFI